MSGARQLCLLRRGLAILLWSVAAASAAETPIASAVIAALERTIMVRAGRDGKTYGEHEVDPLLWPDSTYFLSGESRHRLVGALDAVNQLADADVRRCPPAQRALAQNRAWTVFDYVAATREREHRAVYRELLRALAATMAKLALDEKEIAAIPDPLVAAAKSARWPVAPKGRERVEVFLPPELAREDGAWTTLVHESGEVMAPNHARTFGGRSVFTVRVRFPAQGPNVADYFQRVAAIPVPWVAMANDVMSLALSPDVPALPVDTEVALIRRVAVIDREGRWRATPLTLSVQLRHYWVTTRDAYPKSLGADGQPAGVQSFAKFELDPAPLARGGMGELRALTADEKGFGFFFAHSFDQVDGAGGFPGFEAGPHHETMRACFQCHSQAGLGSFNSLGFFTRAVPLPRLVTAEEGREVAATENWKTVRVEWGMLQAFWPAQSAH